MSASFLMRGIAAACLLCTGLPAMAQLNLPNALVRPQQKKPELADPNINPQGKNVVTAAPIEAPRPGSFSVDGARPESTGPDTALTAARQAFAGYQVSAIVGSTAILRRQVAAGTPGGVPALANGQMAMPAPAAAAAPAAGAAMRTESMTIRHGEQFEVMSGTGTYTGKISNGRVIIVFDGAQGARKGPSGAHATVVYAGELSMGHVTPPTIVLQTKDSDLKASLKIQAGSSTGSGSGGSSSPTSPAMPAPVTPVSP